MPLPPDHPARMARARLALDGLSVGDAFGDRFFRWPPELITEVRATRRMAETYWKSTDDTEMALAIVEVLDAHGQIDQDALAAAVAARYAADDRRGYGSGAHALLMSLCRQTYEQNSADFKKNRRGNTIDSVMQNTPYLWLIRLKRTLFYESRRSSACARSVKHDHQRPGTRLASLRRCLDRPADFHAHGRQ